MPTAMAAATSSSARGGRVRVVGAAQPASGLVRPENGRAYIYSGLAEDSRSGNSTLRLRWFGAFGRAVSWVRPKATSGRLTGARAEAPGVRPARSGRVYVMAN